MSIDEKENLSVAESQDEQLAVENLDIKKEEGKDSKLNLVNESVDSLKKKFKRTSFDEKELYREILEKLGMNSKDNNIENKDNIDDAKFQQNHQKERAVQVENNIKTALAQDFEKIQKLLQLGLVNPAQGQNLKNQVLKKAFDTLVQTGRANQGGQKALPDSAMVIESLNKSNCDFFDSQGRKEVLNYLKSSKNSLRQDELGKISELVEIVEKAAVERYLQNTAHDEAILSSNEKAKQRLTANAQKSSRSDNLSRTFTREQIGKMSSAEFTKYEPLIMDQLKKGLIR